MVIAFGIPGPIELLVIAVLLGVPVLCIVFLARWLLKKRSADRETRCRKCGYILRGIPEPRCSECGERI